jgi:E3 SUMO-protein ligase PIAS1
MASTGQDPADLLNAIARIKTLTNAQLKDILRNEGLPVSGVKISLQTRIITYNIPLNRYGETLREGAP